MSNTVLSERPLSNGKIVFGLCSLLSLPVCAETFKEKAGTKVYQEEGYSQLLAAGPSFFDLPSPPTPPAPPVPRVYSPRYRGDGQRPFREGPSIYGGWSTGGDILKTYKGSELKAGDGYSVHFGWNVDFKTGSERTALQWAVGYRWSELSYKDGFGRSGTAKMSVFPLDTLAYFQHGLFRIGGGLTYHLFPQYKEETNYTRKIDFKSQLGFIASMELVGIDAPFFINLQYIYIVYKPKDGSYLDLQTNEIISEVNGSNFTINIGLHMR
jgi:hypothetical protein